eukprot:13704261-Alexandrium_andersonii.AAC.1
MSRWRAPARRQWRRWLPGRTSNSLRHPRCHGRKTRSRRSLREPVGQRMSASPPRSTSTWPVRNPPA